MAEREKEREMIRQMSIIKSIQTHTVDMAKGGKKVSVSVAARHQFNITSEQFLAPWMPNYSYTTYVGFFVHLIWLLFSSLIVRVLALVRDFCF